MISIILPTYNGSQFIAGSINSVLSQTYKDWELIIISDGSTDETKVVVDQFLRNDKRIIFIENEKNLGIQKTLNKAITLSKGEYIARIDDDDRWVTPTKLAEQLSFFETYQDHVLVGTDALVVDTNGTILSKNIMPKTDKAIRAKMLSKNCFLHATIMVKKMVVEQVGGYSEDKLHLHAEDYDLWLRMGLAGKMANLSVQSTHLVTHSHSLTFRNRVLQARHVFLIMLRYKKKYPNFLEGYIASLTRIVFFSIFTFIKLPRGIMYNVQRIYRSV
jgi:glycosyltransferase involved in cell wall biosynthesis